MNTPEKNLLKKRTNREREEDSAEFEKENIHSPAKKIIKAASPLKEPLEEVKSPS